MARAEITANRLGMSDHGYVHLQIVLWLFRLLVKRNIEPALVTDHGMIRHDAEVPIAAGCLLHDAGMSIHRTDHEAYSLFLAADKLGALLDGIYDDPERSIVVAQALHAIIGHRRRGDPITVEAGIVRVADALDMAEGRSRVPFETGRPNIHSLSAVAIDEVKIEAGEEKAVRIEIDMNNSSGLSRWTSCWPRSCAARAWRTTSRSWRASPPSTRSASCPGSGSRSAAPDQGEPGA